MADVVLVAVIVAFFCLTALLVRVLGRVTDASSTELEPELGEAAEVTADQRHALLSDDRK